MESVNSHVSKTKALSTCNASLRPPFVFDFRHCCQINLRQRESEANNFHLTSLTPAKPRASVSHPHTTRQPQSQHHKFRDSLRPRHFAFPQNIPSPHLRTNTPLPSQDCAAHTRESHGASHLPSPHSRGNLQTPGASRHPPRPPRHHSGACGGFPCLGPALGLRSLRL